MRRLKNLRFAPGFILIMFSICAIPTAGLQKAGATRNSSIIRVMTFNIRYNNPGDKENAWPNRKEMAASMFRFHHVEIAGVQEALRGQIDDLAGLLPEFGWTGVGRDDGKDKGEFSAIFYRKDRFKLLESSTFWLSETPESVGSKGWDANLPRVVTWARFRDLKSGKTFLHFNTHFDHRGEQARIESARLILSRIEKMAAAFPVIVTGDFNVRESSEAYRIMIGGANAQEKSKPLLQDARYSSVNGHHGPTGTFTNFGPLISGSKIDYIFVRNGIKVLQHGALSDQWDGRWPSDHLPVLAEIDLGGGR